jgi:RimJ/RimL family protein N-acetyltransferase
MVSRVQQPAPPTGIFPAVEIVTRRLRLRAYRSTDAQAHRTIFDNAHSRRWSITPWPYPPDLAERWCSDLANRIRLSGDGICWAGEDRETGRLVGLTGFHDTNWVQRSTEVSANASKEVMGRGFASEALRAISHWVLTECGFNRVQITAAAGNLAPQKVAEACGFVREGVLRNAGTDAIGRVDMALYSLVPDDLPHLPVPEYSVTTTSGRRSGAHLALT